MYKILGTDNKEYGPVSAEVLRQWIAERRVDGRTLLQAGSSGWKPLAEFPEFAGVVAAGPAFAAPGPVSMQPQMPAAPVRTSGLAVASLVCGVLGCFGITALLGLVFGIIAQVSISRSNGRLKGSGLAIAGICVSAVMLLFAIPFLSGLTLPALAKAKGRAQTINCVTRMKQLALGVRLHANDNKDMFPPADSWCDAVQVELGNAKLFVCPSAGDGHRCTYAMNRKVAGKKSSEVDPRTVLLFEINDGWNVSGGPELMDRSRHGPIVVVAFVDGSVQQMSPSRLSTLRWDP